MMPEEVIYRRLLSQAAERLIPASVMCNLTWRCPLRCGHCYRPPLEPGEKELTLAEYGDLFGQLAASGTFTLALSGGEPLARPDFLDVLAAARRRAFAVRLFTGGVGLPAVADEVARLGVMAVELTLHAGSPPLHDGFVGRAGSWEEAMAGARLLRERGVHVMIKFNAMNFNYREFRAVFEVATALEAEFHHAVHIFTTAAGSSAPYAHRMSDEQLAEYYNASPRPEVPAAEPCDDEPVVRQRRNDRALSCMAAYNNCSIGPYGDVWPCVAMPVTLGNVRRQPFAEIWTGEGIRRVRGYAALPAPECAACELDAYCARCAAQAMVAEGDVAKPVQESCRLARAAKENKERAVIK